MIGNLQPSPILKTAAMNQISLVWNINLLIKSIKLELNILLSVIVKAKNLLTRWAIKNIWYILNMLIIAITLKLKLKNYKTIVAICFLKTHSVYFIIQYDPKPFLFKLKTINTFYTFLNSSTFFVYIWFSLYNDLKS